jgi:hypothetical protein
MKKFLSIALLAISLLFVTSVSCEEEKPLCERNNFCKVIVHNDTSIALWVDCTEPGDYMNIEKRLMPGTSYTYTMTPGNLTVWATDDAGHQADEWDWDEIFVYQCEEHDFTWYKKKSLNITSKIGNQK